MLFVAIVFHYRPQMSGLQQQMVVVEQLRQEAALKRINVGQAVDDIKVMDKPN
jgi:hypothetical protein